MYGVCVICSVNYICVCIFAIRTNLRAQGINPSLLGAPLRFSVQYYADSTTIQTQAASGPHPVAARFSSPALFARKSGLLAASFVGHIDRRV